MSQFRETRNLYLSALSGFTFPLTYNAWLNADAEYKAVLLFVNFFDQIELAFYKTRFSFVLEEDAVSQVNVYLMKNVPFIEADESRFRASYIYTVAANCLRSLTYIERDINREKFETPNEVNLGDSTVDLFDLTPSQDDTYEEAQAKDAVWAIIDKMDPKARKVINQLINPDESLSKTRNKDDLLADVSVSQAEVSKIIEDIRAELAPFAKYFLPVKEETYGESARDRFLKEIDALRQAMYAAKTEKAKKDCMKAIIAMKKDLVTYDTLQAGYSV